MSRIANAPINIPSGVEVALGSVIKVKGSKGELEFTPHENVTIEQEDAKLKVKTAASSQSATALAGTTRALLNNMVTGVTQGFEKKLTIVGVGYRAQAQGQKLNLTLLASVKMRHARFIFARLRTLKVSLPRNALISLVRTVPV